MAEEKKSWMDKLFDGTKPNLERESIFALRAAHLDHVEKATIAGEQPMSMEEFRLDRIRRRKEKAAAAKKKK